MFMLRLVVLFCVFVWKSWKWVKDMLVGIVKVKYWVVGVVMVLVVMIVGMRLIVDRFIVLV